MSLIRNLLWIIFIMMMIYVFPTDSILASVKHLGDRNEIQKVDASTSVQ